MDLHMLFLIGLPGSGKTHYANLTKYPVYSLDTFRDSNNEPQMDLLHKALHKLQTDLLSSDNIDTFVLDGLFTTTQSICEALDLIKETLSNHSICIEFHKWSDDKEICKLNTQHHMDDIIDNMSYDVSMTYIHNRYKNTNIGFYISSNIFHNVEPHIYKDNIDILSMIDDYSISKDGKNLLSSYWRGEEEPENFTALDNVLETLCPNLLYKDYKYIRRNCITSDTWEEKDYYDTYIFTRWVCDVVELYKTLVNLGYLK